MNTETLNGTNITGNELSVDCISSNQNKFHLDSEGNLTVKSITTLEDSNVNILSQVYPVGSIYMNMSLVDPSVLFGGTWTQLKDRFLLGVGDIYQSNQTGGEASHTLISAELPSNNQTLFRGPGNQEWGAIIGTKKCDGVPTIGANFTNGQNKPHNNMPPYLTVYMWQRVS